MILENMASLTSSEAAEEPLDVTLNGSSSSVIPDRYGFIGSSESNLSAFVGADVIRRREQKWLDMLNNWDEYMTKNFKMVRKRCQKGIPASLRARAWLFLCGGKIHMDQNANLFLELTRNPGNKKWIDDIKKDLHRQFPLHEIFAQNGGYGQGDLYLILKAYTILNPEIGYCQAQAPVAATLLMHMPAEQAFWCLVSISDKYLTGYYSPGLEAVQLDGAILFGLLRKIDYQVYKHLKKQKIEPVLYMTEWFLCIFSRTLPWPSVLRVWDMFFCEGVKVLFRVGLVLLRLALGSSETRKKCPSMSETLQVLWNIPEECLQEDKLYKELEKINLTVYDMEKEHHKQQRKRKLAEKAG